MYHFDDFDDFEVFCAICGSTTGYSNVTLGSRDPQALRRRRRVIRKRQQGLNQGHRRARDELKIIDSRYEGDGDGEANCDHHSEDFGYDPDLVAADRSWLESMRCLGFNEGVPGDTKGWISGSGITEYYGAFVINEIIDPNHPDDDSEVSCYKDFRDEASCVVFPSHTCCLEILVRFLTGSTDVNALNKDALYNALSDVAGDRSIDFNYGVQGQGQYWDCIPGEEFAVAYPMVIPGLTEFLKTQMLSAVQKTPYLGDDLVSKVAGDSMGKLPPEVLHEILLYLSGQEMLAFRKASLAVLRATSNSSFWKKRILRDVPWFWELDGLIEDAQSGNLNLDYKCLYLWLKMTTRELFGNDSPFLGLVNRSRIWGVCEEAGRLYFKKSSDNKGSGQKVLVPC